MMLKPMLAASLPASLENFPFEKGWLIQPKVDGVRVLLPADGIPYTRNGKPIRNNQLREFLYPYRGKCTKDYEVFYKDIRETTSIVNSIAKPLPDDLDIHLLDVMIEGCLLYTSPSPRDS